MDVKFQIEQWSQRDLPEELYLWGLTERLKIVHQSEHFFSAFSLAGLKSQILPQLSHVQLDVKEPESFTWSARQWQSSTLLRAILLTEFPPSHWLEKIEATLITADFGESVDLYRLLPLCWGCAEPERLLWRLSEGVRNNAQPILEACLLNSPLPVKIFDRELWNRMMLKAFHLNVSVEKIEGRNSRRNDQLDQMLLAFASEKALGQREIPEALWEEFQPQSSMNFLQELQRLINEHKNSDFRRELTLRFGSRLKC